MKKLIVFWVTLCVLLTACASSQKPPAQSDPAPNTQTDTAPTPPEGNDEITPETPPAPVVVSPLPTPIDPSNPGDCTVAVSLSEGDVFADENGIMQMRVVLYVYDLYDMADISLLKEGDTIIIQQQEIIISSLANNDYGNILINGGLDQGGYELRTDENTVYYETGYSDVKSWQEIGEITLPLSSSFVYTDRSNLDSDAITYHPSDFLNPDSGIDYGFTPHNTSILIEDGVVISMERVYTP